MSEVSEQDLPPVDRRALVRDAVRYGGLGGAVVAVAVALFAKPALAISILLGTALGAVNFVLLARGVGGAIDRTVAGVERTRQERPLAHTTATGSSGDGLEPEDVADRPRGVGMVLRLAFVVLLVAGMLWYPPTEPAGLAIGVIIVLLGGSAAAYRHQRAR